MNTRSTVEPLEARIAPATLVNLTTVTYLDGDGDRVTIKISKGFFDDPADPLQADFVFSPIAGGVPGSELLEILDLRDDAILDGANLTITAVPFQGRGDGTVNVGYIDAQNIDLGSVTVRGDLGAIDAGDANLKDGGLKSLSVLSLGGEGLLTGAPDLVSDIVGAVGAIRVTGDIVDARISITAPGDLARGSLGSLFVGGSIVGGTADDSGQVLLAGKLGTATIQGDLLGGDGVALGRLDAARFGTIRIGGTLGGGTGFGSGQIFAEGAISGITIGGDVIGNDGSSTGVISAASIGSAQIDGSVFGGLGSDSGKIEVDANITTLRIGGSLVGASLAGIGSANSGFIFAGGKLGTVVISGSIRGGNSEPGFANENTGYVEAGSIGKMTVGGSVAGGDDDGGTLLNSGAIRAFGNIGTLLVKGGIYGGDSSGSGSNSATGYVEADRLISMTVNGSVFSGSDVSGGLFSSGAIRAWQDIGALTVRGSLEGNANTPVIVSAVGQPSATGSIDLAMRTVTVLGRVFNAEILAGYSPDVTASFFGEAVNADAQIGTVRVGGDWITSDLIAGVTHGGDSFFGDAADAKIDITGVVDGRDRADTVIISKISSIVIGGRVLGTSPSNDAFRTGFGAQHVVSMKVGGVVAIPLLAGRSNDTFASAAGAYPLGQTLGTANADGFDVHVFEV